MSMTGFQSLLLAAVMTPLLSALALTVRRWRSWVLRFVPLATLPALTLAIFGPLGTTLEIPWAVKDANLRFDDISQVFMLFTSILWLAAAWYAQTYLAEDQRRTRFYLLFLLAMAGNFTVIVANDIPSFYIGFALMSFASTGLVMHRGDQEALRAGRTYLILVMIGEVLLFAAFTFLSFNHPSLNIATLHQQPIAPMVLILILTAFGIKAGALSLHFWLPLAHPAAPVPASAVLSGAMIKAGLLGWLRFLPLGTASLPDFGYFAIVGGLGAAFFGTFVGVTQSNPKAVLAYSSISQMGIITIGIGVGLVLPEIWPSTLAAILLYSAHHGLAKGALFLSIGPAQGASRKWEVFVVRIGLLIPALALAGAPFTSGALAKLALKSNVALLPDAWATWVGVLLPLAAIGTTLKMLRFLWLTWPSVGSREAKWVAGTVQPWLFLVLAVASLFWFLPGTAAWLPGKFTLEKLWLATWPLFAGGALAYLGARLSSKIRPRQDRALPAGDIIVGFEWLARLLAKLLPPPQTTHHEPIVTPHRISWVAKLLGHAQPRLLGAERLLRQSSCFGASLLVIILVLCWLLAGN